MALDLYMLGLIVADMGKSLEFYRRLGLAIPDGSERQTHVEVKMGNGLTFFLDSRPTRWDSSFVKSDEPGRVEAPESYRSVLEFYLQTRDAVEAKYQELTDFGYQGHRAPYATSFGMCFALIKDPDGNTILLSGDWKERQASQEA
jgi:catechol 2,3-dioxygenase-like lactoylglutathione lyase family enzyme